MSTTYQVAWSYCTVKVLDHSTGGYAVVGFGKDAIVPDSADPADVKRLVGKGALVAVETAPAPEPAAKPAKEPDAAATPAAKPPAKAAAKAGHG